MDKVSPLYRFSGAFEYKISSFIFNSFITVEPADLFLIIFLTIAIPPVPDIKTESLNEKNLGKFFKII